MRMISLMTEVKSNGILAYLDPDALSRMQSRLHLVMLEAEEVVYHPGDRISHIYFPATAVLCMMTIMENGDTVEAATVGREGASWVSASLGAPTMPCQTMVSVSGSCYKLEAQFVEEEIRRNRLFHDLVSEYAHALLISSLRTGACNALHSFSQRAARWMLTTADRTLSNEVFITHQFMSALLGGSRSVLTNVLGELENLGGIRTGRGHIELVDRTRLKESSCECYQVLRENFLTLQTRARALAKHSLSVS
jgi:CRP-like cAMP-binding protein